MNPGLRRLYAPKLATVEVGDDGSPRTVEGVAVAAMREEWQVEDRWWTPSELRRHYYELALDDGRAVVAFRCGFSGRWYRQRA